MKRQQAILAIGRTLVARRNALRKALAGELASLSELNDQQPPGSLIDHVMVVAAGNVNSQLAEVEGRELVRIDEALERIRSGKYGICEDCKTTIKMVRLAVLPCATRCIECQREAEKEAASAEAAVL